MEHFVAMQEYSGEWLWKVCGSAAEARREADAPDHHIDRRKVVSVDVPTGVSPADWVGEHYAELAAAEDCGGGY